MSQITRKFHLSFLPYLTIPPSVWFAMPTLMHMNSQDAKTRLERRGTITNLDYFETLVPFDAPVPADKKEIKHLENIAGQLLLASWQPLANQFYSLIFFLLKEPEIYATLVGEVRAAFGRSEDINMGSVASLRYLNACVSESLRLHQDTVDGLPRISPGAFVDGIYVPRGVCPSTCLRDYLFVLTNVTIHQTTCQISYFAASRSPRFFTDPLTYIQRRRLESIEAL
jgi:hypothetical protein